MWIVRTETQRSVSSPPPTRNTAEGLPSRRWTKAWKLGGSLCSHPPSRTGAHTAGRQRHTASRRYAISLPRTILGPRTTNVSFLTASALSTSARGTGPLPTTACDGCSPGLPLTTNPPLGRCCDSSGDPAGIRTRHGAIRIPASEPSTAVSAPRPRGRCSHAAACDGPVFVSG